MTILIYHEPHLSLAFGEPQLTVAKEDRVKKVRLKERPSTLTEGSAER